MEASMMKPKRNPKPKPRPSTAPPKPPEVRRNHLESPEIPTPALPPRPTDPELSHTQFRVKRMAAAINEQSNGNVKQGDTKEKLFETPVVPPRPTEKELNSTTRYSQRIRAETEGAQRSRQTDQPEAAAVPKVEVDFRQNTQPILTGMFQRSQKEKTPIFPTYVTHNVHEEERADDVPAKQAPSNKPGVLKGVMKGLQFKSSPKASKDPSPDTRAEEAGSEKEQSAEKNKQEKNTEPKEEKGSFFSGILKKSNKQADEASAQTSSDPSPDHRAEEAGSEKEQSAEKKKQDKNVEPKQDKGLLAGMFRKTPKEKSSSPALTGNKADSDNEDTEDEEKTSEQTQEKGGFLSGILKKSNKSTDETSQLNLSVHGELSASSDSLSENSNKEKAGIFSGMFKKSPKPPEAAQTDQDQQSLHGDLSGSNDNLTETQAKEKGFFSGILRKSPKIPGEGISGQDKESLQNAMSASNDSLSENSNTKEKGGVFSAMFKKSPKPSEGPRLEEGAEPLSGELSASTDSLSENKEKGHLFSGLLRKTPKTTGEENLSAHKDVSGSSDSLSEAGSTKEKGSFGEMLKKSLGIVDSFPTEEDKKSQDNELQGTTEGQENNTKEKGGGIFSGMFKKPHKSAEAAQSEEDLSSDNELSASNENLVDNRQEKGGGLFSGLLKKTPKAAGERVGSPDRETQRELSGSNDDLSENNSSKDKKGGLAGLFKRSGSIDIELFDEDKDSQKALSASNYSLSENSKEKNIFSGMFKKPQKPANEESGEGKRLSASCENLLEANTSKEKTGGLAGIFKKSPKPVPRSITTEDPLTVSRQQSISLDNLTEIGKENHSAQGELSASNENLDATNTKEKKGGFAGMFRRTPKNEVHQESENGETPTGGGLRRRRTIKKKQRVVSFRVKKTLPKIPRLNFASQSSDEMSTIEETVELQELIPAQESTVEVQPLEMAAYPTADNPAELEHNELMEWWNSVKGWTEWNEASNFNEEDEQAAMEQAADRVFMAARLFVHLFNQRGASLQHRILELLALADAADYFHKKTTTAAVGGGVASVAGSVTTITGLILAPFTFGASIIVTAVGIGVATAGSIASATANITDTVHSNMDRKKVEKMIQGYQDEIKDIRECLEFVQEGMNTLEEWDFEKYSESAGKKALNHNIKHVVKEGGRAGKALMINTDKLISTVQVLGAAGGVAKAAQAISVTTGVMSALFLALDIFFLAKDSHKLRKGAKTKFASKIRDVCKDLQDGLLELNKMKTQLQKTMDGIEVEEYEEIEEVEVEVEDDLESDPMKLAELEQELDLLEEKLDKKLEEEQKKAQEKSIKEKEELDEEDDEEESTEKNKSKEKDDGEVESQSKSEPNEEEEQKIPKEEALKEEPQKGSKKEKDTENRITAGKEKHESKRDKMKEDIYVTPDGKEREKSEAGKEQEEVKSGSGDSKQVKSYGEWVKPERESEKRRRSSREDEGGMKPDWKSVTTEKETESRSTRRHSSRSNRDEDRAGKHEMRRTEEERRSRHKDQDSDRMESWRRRGEEDRGMKDWRGEMGKSREERKETKETERWTRGEDHRRNESYRSHEAQTTRRERSERETGSHHRRGHEDHRERGEEKRGSRRQFERAGGEEEERRREHGDSWRRGSDRDGEHHHHSRRGSRPRSNALLEDGLNI